MYVCVSWFLFAGRGGVAGFVFLRRQGQGCCRQGPFTQGLTAASCAPFVFCCCCWMLLLLLLQTSKLRLFDREQPLYSEARVLPPSKVAGGVIMTGGGGSGGEQSEGGQFGEGEGKGRGGGCVEGGLSGVP